MLRARALGAAAALVVGAVAPMTVASSAHAADPIRNCGPAPADIDDSAWGTTFGGTNIRMRRSPNTLASTPVCGLGQPSHRADYHCFTEGEGGTWTYVRDVDTAFAGWVRDDLLTDRGSFDHC